MHIKDIDIKIKQYGVSDTHANYPKTMVYLYLHLHCMQLWIIPTMADSQMYTYVEVVGVQSLYIDSLAFTNNTLRPNRYIARSWGTKLFQEIP